MAVDGVLALNYTHPRVATRWQGGAQVEERLLAGNVDEGAALEVVACLQEHYSGFRWESELWTSLGRRRSPYRALLLFGLSPRTKDWLLVAMCRRIFRYFPDVGTFLAGQRSGQLDEMVRLGQRPFLESAGRVIGSAGGEVPRTKERLLQIRGVGQKVSECVLAYGYGQEALPLDGNVLRVFQRLRGTAGAGSGWNIGDLREWLRGLYQRNRHSMQSGGAALIDLHELFRLHGQVVCVRTPLCQRCPLKGCPSRLRAWDGSWQRTGIPDGFWEDWRELLLDPAPEAKEASHE